MILVITTTGAISKWQKAFGLKKPCFSNYHVRVCPIEAGSCKWESHCWDITLIDRGVMLNTEEKKCVHALSREIHYLKEDR